MAAMPDLAVLLIHYHTPDLVLEALEAVAADCAASGLTWEAVVVDNGSTETGRTVWAEALAAGARRLDPGRNLGYAGGINHGAAATTGRWIVSMNPDVRVRPGCLGRLVETLRQGAGAAGPLFHLDAGGRLLQPPTEERSRRARLLDAYGERSFAAAARARRRWRRHAYRHWRADGPMTSVSLSGALLAFPREVWERVPFDEGYPLYFEEDDWLRRLTGAGHRPVFVPTARAFHAYNRSASGEPRAAAWFAQSQQRFERRWYGGWFSPVARAVAPGCEAAEPWAGVREAAAVRPLPEGRSTLEALPPGTRWLELTPSPKGYPAAAEALEDGTETWSVPEDAWRALGPGRYLAQAVDDRGAELARWVLTRAAGEPPTVDSEGDSP